MSICIRRYACLYMYTCSTSRVCVHTHVRFHVHEKGYVVSSSHPGVDSATALADPLNAYNAFGYKSQRVFHCRCYAEVYYLHRTRRQALDYVDRVCLWSDEKNPGSDVLNEVETMGWYSLSARLRRSVFLRVHVYTYHQAARPEF